VIKDITQQAMQKLELLLDYYKVQRDKDQWHKLSFFSCIGLCAGHEGGDRARKDGAARRVERS